jgi:hypothetical protein
MASLSSALVPPRRHRLIALTAAIALAAPATAFAQSAGDEQYQDPFGGDDQQQSSGDQGSSSGSAGSAQATPTPAPAPAPATPSSSGAAPAASAAAQQLPRTGGDPITPAVAGFWLLLGGVALRARIRLNDRRA